MRLVLTGVLSSDARTRMDLAYVLQDPWRTQRRDEQRRLEEISQFITEHVGPRAESILELGCGEGHHSEHLAKLTHALTGIDVSGRAIERARKKVHSATFIRGDLYEQPWANERGRYELVTACEVLYYVSDKRRFLRAMDQLGRHCVVTFYGRAANLCEPFTSAIPGAVTKRIERDGQSWVLVYWRGESLRS